MVIQKAGVRACRRRECQENGYIRQDVEGGSTRPPGDRAGIAQAHAYSKGSTNAVIPPRSPRFAKLTWLSPSIPVTAILMLTTAPVERIRLQSHTTHHSSVENIIIMNILRERRHVWSKKLGSWKLPSNQHAATPRKLHTRGFIAKPLSTGTGHNALSSISCQATKDILLVKGKNSCEALTVSRQDKADPVTWLEARPYSIHLSRPQIYSTCRCIADSCLLYTHWNTPRQRTIPSSRWIRLRKST